MIWIALSALAGGAWRRWWGDERPAYAFRGFRALQASAGVLALGLFCYLAGAPIWLAAVKAGLAIGFLTTMAESIPHIWRAWEAADYRWGTPRWGRMLTGYTAYAEATCGAVVWAIATMI
jgi:hypothetical protein